MPFKTVILGDQPARLHRDFDPYQHQPRIGNTQHLSMADIAVFRNNQLAISSPQFICP
jgi:hypothetical protein